MPQCLESHHDIYDGVRDSIHKYGDTDGNADVQGGDHDCIKIDNKTTDDST
jgi:hypothetical protein